MLIIIERSEESGREREDFFIFYFILFILFLFFCWRKRGFEKEDNEWSLAS